MPVRQLPSNPSLDHLKYQAKDLRNGHAAHDIETAQRIREFHPRFNTASDDAIFSANFSLADAQLAIAREHGFPSWARLKAYVETPTPAGERERPHHERITDVAFRHAVNMMDSGDEAGLRACLNQHPELARRRVVFEGVNYFRNPTLLEFMAENPVRHGKLPANIVAIAKVLLDAGAERATVNETLGLVCSGRVAEFEAVNALMARGAPMDLPAAAALGRVEDAVRLRACAGPEDRHRALALAAQFGRVDIVRMLLDGGEDPDRYDPSGCHSHATPMHQAALAGHEPVVRLLVERGARVDLKDILWHGTPADWAKHAGHAELETYLRAQPAEKYPD